MRFLIVASVCCAFFLLPAGAQGQVRAELASAQGPVQFVAAAGGQPAGWPAQLSARNISAHRIVTVVVGVQLYGRDGTLQMTNTHAYTRLATSERWVPPGAVIPMPLPRINFTAGPAPATAKIWVDLVVFADGSTWGPNRLRQAARWTGVQEGIQLERLHLQRVLRRTGPQGVRAALASQ
ncbi:MAG: hypothetical protein ACRD2F_04470 [Terriglobales bacterium]